MPTKRDEAIALRAKGLLRKEIAARLGVSVNAVDGLLYRSREAWRKNEKAKGNSTLVGFRTPGMPYIPPPRS